jgi:hypothetical protein
MSGISRPVRLALVGWAMVFLFAIMILVAHGTGELAPALVVALVAIGMGTWIWGKPNLAALVTSAVLGLLHTVEQTAYLTADITAKDLNPAVLVGDFLGLIGGVLIVVGTTVAIARRHRNHANTADSAPTQIYLPTD